AEGDTEPETDATLPLKPKKPSKKDEEEEPEESDGGSPKSPVVPEDSEEVRETGKPTPVKKKPVWEPPPPVPQEPYEFPPEEKKLCDILKEEKIPPTQRYAKKPRKMDVLIPCKIPWEFWPCIQTQEGMGAFGHQRNPYTKVDQGSKTLVQGEVHSETVIPLISQAHGASKAGMLPFGAYRRNVSSIIDSHEFDTSKASSTISSIINGSFHVKLYVKLCEQYIPLMNKGSRNWIENDTGIGNIRNQTMNIKYSKKLTSSVQPQSHTFISRQFAPTSEVAGSNIIGKPRGIILKDDRGEVLAKCDRESETIVPRLFNTESTYLKSGADFGSFRPLICESQGGFTMTYDEEVLCKLVLPYQVSTS
ncbi:unnamed protein product, partial [Enterobius vermicularis]|uniref:Envelope glycoprotein n=1 Tax=Enterobius vermicularis TaxID=51028 RepID=A0A0N4V2N9_ENTVE